jgi:two-component system, chemotaxis family, chemotaxis protein CheY
MTPRVLIVDGSETERSAVATLLAGAGYELDDAPDGIEAFEKLLALSYDLVVTEAKLDRLDSPDLIAKLRAHGVKTPVLVLSAVTKGATVAALIKLGIAAYVHKATPPEQIRQRIAAALPGRSAVASSAAARASDGTAPSTGGGVLLVDAIEAEHHRLRALVPPSIPIDGCKTFNEALARARGGHYRLILLDADASVLNLGGVVVQLHVLQPEAAVIAAATLGQHGERGTVIEAHDVLGFDDVVFKPLAQDDVSLLVDRHCTTWKDLVGVKDDLIEVSRMSCRRDEQQRYRHELETRIESALSALSDACFDRAILDLTRVEVLAASDAAELLVRSKNTASVLGIKLVVAVPPALSDGLRAFQESFAGDRFRWFSSAVDARASLG